VTTSSYRAWGIVLALVGVVAAAVWPILLKLAYAYVADRHHPHYAGKLTPEEAADFILQGCGERGTCLDYLTSTVQHMDELGIADSALHELLDLVLERVRRGELAPQPVR